MWRFWATSVQQWRLEMGARSVWEGEDEQSQIFEGKLKQILKTAFISAKTRVFRDWNKSPQSRQLKPPKHTRPKIWKIFLSVFRDWKVYPRVSRELSRENLWVTSRLDLPLANKSPEITSEGATEARDLTYPRLSRQNRAKLDFWNFQIFQTNYFPKTPKTLKNLFVLDLTKIEHVKTHFIKYNHTNEYGIYWT